MNHSLTPSVLMAAFARVLSMPPTGGAVSVQPRWEFPVGMCPWCGMPLHPGKRCENDDAFVMSDRVHVCRKGQYAR